MEKIISLFKRDYEGTRLVFDEVVEGAEWVQEGVGVPTVKRDGTCCLIRGGLLYKRYDAKKGKQPPANFEPAQDPDPITGHWPGWVPVGAGPGDQWHREAFSGQPDGTYELIGPKVQGNPYSLSQHVLVRHGGERIMGVPTDFEGLRFWLSTHTIEGIVWHNPDGRMVKIKRRDFGLKWPVQP